MYHESVAGHLGISAHAWLHPQIWLPRACCRICTSLSAGQPRPRGTTSTPSPLPHCSWLPVSSLASCTGYHTALWRLRQASRCVPQHWASWLWLNRMCQHHFAYPLAVLATRQAAIFPLLDQQRRVLLATPGSDKSATAFAEMLVHSRRYFLQAAPLVELELPHLSLFRYHPFTTPEYASFKAQVRVSKPSKCVHAWGQPGYCTSAHTQTHMHTHANNARCWPSAAAIGPHWCRLRNSLKRCS